MSSFIRSSGLSIRDRNSKYTYFQTEVSEMTLKVDQGHWRWYNLIGHVSLSVSASYLVLLSRDTPTRAHGLTVFAECLAGGWLTGIIADLREAYRIRDEFVTISYTNGHIYFTVMTCL